MIYQERDKRIAVLRHADKSTEELKRLPYMSKTYNEAWLQELIDEYPSVLPMHQFGDDYSNLISLGREIEVYDGQHYGYIDNLLISPSGHVVIVETKLFRNQESRRTVVAQILDYAKEVRKWDAEKLDEAITDYTQAKYGQSYRMIDLMCAAGYLTFSDEAAFTDNVNRNLTNASFLLAIVGDGISSGVASIADFLNQNAPSRVNLALIQLDLYELNGDVIVIPNTLARTSVIERFVATVSNAPVKIPSGLSVKTDVDKPILSRAEFIRRFAELGGYSEDAITEFIGDAEMIDGIFVNIAPTELHLRCAIDNSTVALIIFAIPEYKHADLYIRPDRFRKKLEVSGRLPADMNDFLDFFKPYCDLQRCKAAPYEFGENRFYYANISKVIEDKQKFIKALEDLVAKIREA